MHALNVLSFALLVGSPLLVAASSFVSKSPSTSRTLDGLAFVVALLAMVFGWRNLTLRYCAALMFIFALWWFSAIYWGVPAPW